MQFDRAPQEGSKRLLGGFSFLQRADYVSCQLRRVENTRRNPGPHRGTLHIKARAAQTEQRVDNMPGAQNPRRARAVFRSC